jgi:hypothetical protein
MAGTVQLLVTAVPMTLLLLLLLLLLQAAPLTAPCSPHTDNTQRSD